eukprot:m.118041 g.118041  ORF g.118041 m.118041 type:complete len:57 (-) comp28627_c1_seq4:168-338(-)
MKSMSRVAECAQLMIMIMFNDQSSPTNIKTTTTTTTITTTATSATSATILQQLEHQ